MNANTSSSPESPALPTPDAQHAMLPAPAAGLTHAYGPRVHLLSFPWPISVLARLCSEKTTQPEVNVLVGQLYDWLLCEVASRELARERAAVPTRMLAHNPEGVFQGERIDPSQRVVVVDIARAGMLPALRFYEGLNYLLDPANVRQDHVIASRVADESGRVVGVRVDATKIGGSVEDATVFLPDPMAATGTSVSAVINRYLNTLGGRPRRIVAVHLIVTPEYLREITRAFPEVEIYAVRLDRGLSAPDVLSTTPGERWDEERGLNDHQYIVPGGGGFGEIMNNAWV